MSGKLDSWFTAGGSGRHADDLSQDLYKVTDFPQYLKETQVHCQRPLLIPPCNWTWRVSLSLTYSFQMTDCPPMFMVVSIF